MISNELIAGCVVLGVVLFVSICMMLSDIGGHWAKEKTSVAQSAVDLEVAKKERIMAEIKLTEAQYAVAMNQHEQMNKEKSGDPRHA